MLSYLLINRLLRGSLCLSPIFASLACGFIGLEPGENLNSQGRGLDQLNRSDNGTEENSSPLAAESIAKETAEQSSGSQEGTATTATDDPPRLDGFGGAPGDCDNGECEELISVLFVDDFESGELGEEAFESDAGVLEVADNKQKDGNYSLHASHLGSGFSESGLFHSFSELEEIHFSTWMYMPRLDNGGAFKLLSFLSKRDELSVWLDEYSRLEVMLPGRDYYQTSEKKFTYNQWSCLQISYTSTSEEVSLSVSLNDKRLLDFTSSSQNTYFPINEIEYGLLEVAQEEQKSSIYWDNVVASTQPIGCFNDSSLLVERLDE
jgi:hypothetical protein